MEIVILTLTIDYQWTDGWFRQPII